MIVRVVNKKQRILGYLIDNYFYPTNFITRVTSKILFESTVFGYEKRNGILVDGILYLYKSTDYLLQLRKQKALLKLNDLSFIERKPTVEELNRLSSFWQIKSRSTRYFYTIVDSDLTILGYFTTNKSIYHSSTCYLVMLEILEKNRGIGTSVVSKLTSMVSITGLSYIDAVSFWKRNGAVFHEDNRFDLVRNI